MEKITYIYYDCINSSFKSLNLLMKKNLFLKRFHYQIIFVLEVNNEWNSNQVFVRRIKNDSLMYLRQPTFTYSACRSFTKNKND